MQHAVLSGRKMDWETFFAKPPKFLVLDEFDAMLTGAHEQGAWQILRQANKHRWKRQRDGESAGLVGLFDQHRSK